LAQVAVEAQFRQGVKVVPVGLFQLHLQVD
jgi:hypothetical protein